MPKLVPPLNAKQVEKLRPHRERTLELVDGAVPGLRVRLTPNGTLTWSLSFRIHGERRRLTLGIGLGLAEARRKAEGARAQISGGVDPGAAKNAASARRKAAADGFGTLDAVVSAYFTTGPGKDLRSEAAARALITAVFKEFMEWPALDIRPAQLQIAADSWRSQSTAARAIAFFRPLAGWAKKRELMVSGFDDLEMPALTSTGYEIKQRALSRAETERLLGGLGWRAHDLAARFMLLTGARREEVVGAMRGEFEFEAGTWTIPASRRKDTRGPSRRRRRPATNHVVPLSSQARQLIDGLKLLEPDQLMFVGNRAAKLTNWPRWTARVAKKTGVAEVTPHSLRRTVATFAGDVGSPPHVISAILGHSAIGGSLLAGYNKSRFTSEVKHALQLVGDLLESLSTNQAAQSTLDCAADFRRVIGTLAGN